MEKTENNGIVVCQNCGASTPEQSLAEYRNKVIEECAALCDRFAAREMHPAECASAIRAMKED